MKLTAVASSVASIDDIILTAVVSNPTAEDIKLVKFNSVLDKLPTKSFKVKKGDEEVKFHGIDVSSFYFKFLLRPYLVADATQRC